MISFTFGEYVNRIRDLSMIVPNGTKVPNNLSHLKTTRFVVSELTSHIIDNDLSKLVNTKRIKHKKDNVIEEFDTHFLTFCTRKKDIIIEKDKHSSIYSLDAEFDEFYDTKFNENDLFLLSLEYLPKNE